MRKILAATLLASLMGSMAYAAGDVIDTSNGMTSKTKKAATKACIKQHVSKKNKKAWSQCMKKEMAK